MNLNNVFLFVKTGVKNVTFEWFLSIVNWSCVELSRTVLLRRAVIISSHLNVLFSSWTGSLCIFKQPFWEKQWSQMSHLSGFFTWWISELCILKFFWREIFWLQKDIQIFFFLSWSPTICLFELLFTEKFGHKYHIWMIC